MRGKFAKLARRSLSHLSRKPYYRFVPFTSREFGPPRSTLSHPEYAKAQRTDITTLNDAEHHERSELIYDGPGREIFLSRVAKAIPASSVLRVRDARVISPNGWAVGRGDVFLSDASWYRED